jgi:hypothetical protein
MLLGAARPGKPAIPRRYNDAQPFSIRRRVPSSPQADSRVNKVCQELLTDPFILLPCAARGQEQTVSLVPGQVQHVELRFPSREKCVVKFETDNEGVKPSNGDKRTLFFDVENLTERTAQDRKNHDSANG